MNIKHFIADFDGTICKMFTPTTKQYIIDEIYNYFKKYDIDESIKQLNDPYKIWIQCYNEISKEYSESQKLKLFSDSSNLVLALEKEAARYATPYENMYESYEWLSREFSRNAIVSSNHREAIEIVLEKAHLTKLVGPIFGRELITSFSQLKPDTFLLEKALESMNIKSADVLYIGDNEVDMIAAKNTGIFAVGVLRGRDRRVSLENNGAHLIIENFKDIQNVF